MTKDRFADRNAPADLELVKMHLAGSKEAFDRLVSRYSRLCHYYFLQRCRCDLETTKDLVQEAFERVFGNLHKLNSDSHFRAWLMTICRNLAINSLRRRRESSAGADELSSMCISFDRAEKAYMIQKALTCLPDRQREIIDLKYYADLPCSEIASVMDIPEGTVKSELFYARIRLAELLQSPKEESHAG